MGEGEHESDVDDLFGDEFVAEDVRLKFPPEKVASDDELEFGQPFLSKYHLDHLGGEFCTLLSSSSSKSEERSSYWWGSRYCSSSVVTAAIICWGIRS